MRLVILISAVLAGCYGGAYEVGYSSGYGYGPSLVSIEPGVSVVADYDYPVFYADSYYWRLDNGRWYRSTSYTGGWHAWANVPVAVRRIDRPSRYIHYRPHGRDQNAARDHRTWNRPTRVERDHRTQNRPAPHGERRRTPVVRDHREARPSPRVEREREQRRDHRHH